MCTIIIIIIMYNHNTCFFVLGDLWGVDVTMQPPRGIRFHTPKTGVTCLGVHIDTIQATILISKTFWLVNVILKCFIFLFGVLRRFQHCTGHITTGSWKGRGNQYIEFARVVYCKLPTNGKQLPAFPLEPVRGLNPGLRGGRRECYHSATMAPYTEMKS